MRLVSDALLVCDAIKVCCAAQEQGSIRDRRRGQEHAFQLVGVGYLVFSPRLNQCCLASLIHEQNVVSNLQG